MTLDETIKHYEEVAEEYEQKLKDNPNAICYRSEFFECAECAKEHRQLAEWLRELKSYKEQQPCKDCRNCKKWDKCPCGKEGHENGTSIGYSIGECKDYEPSEDCISRAATIQIIENKLNPCTDMFKCLEMSEIKEDVEHLPSVTPTNEDIKEAYLKGYDYGVKDWFKSKTQPSDSNISDPCDGCRYELNSTNGNPCYSCGKYKLTEQQPSEDCVSREEVQDLISIWLSDYLLDETREALETINYKVGDMPAVTPQRPKGKWLHIYKSDIACECSVCHIQMPITEYFHYCPNCGSNMSGGGEDENSN